VQENRPLTMLPFVVQSIDLSTGAQGLTVLDVETVE